MQPDGKTAHAACSAAASTAETTLASSSGGSVFGMATTAVNPPRAAARAPVSTVSACSIPGSRKCTCKSTNPGAMTQPPASTTCARGPASTDSATSAITPLRTSTSPTRSPVMSTTRPPLMTRSRGNGSPRSEDGVEHGHADRDAVRHLLTDRGRGCFRDLGGNLDAAVHGPGMHDQRVGSQPPGAFDGEAPSGRVFAQAREQRFGEPLLLDAQQVDDIEVGEDRVEIVGDPHRPALE